MRIITFLFLSLFPLFTFAQPAKIAALKVKVNTAVEQIENKCVAWRHQLHHHPELSNREVNTARLVADHLKKLHADGFQAV